MMKSKTMKPVLILLKSSSSRMFPFHSVMETLNTPAEHRIFLSHSGQQKGFARDLYNRLSTYYYDDDFIFFDQEHHSLPPGQPFPPLILSAANTCNLAIVVLSHDFLSSRWPMIELCAFADRLRSPTDGHSSEVGFTLLPLFLKLSPDDVKKQENLDRWRKTWEDFAQKDGRFIASNCERAVTKVCSLNGILRRPESEQGEASYLEAVVDKIRRILPPPLENPPDPTNEYAGIDRLCKVILDKFGELEETRSSSMQACILGMYGVPGTGKSTLCRCLCACESMFREFSGNVVHLDLHTECDSHANKVSLIKDQLSPKLFSMFNIYVRDVASMDLNAVLRRLIQARSVKKALVVLDNMSESNYESYTKIVKALLISSTVLGPGSKILLVAQSSTLLDGFGRLLTQGERCSSKYRFAIMEVPQLTAEEAIEVLRNQCPSIKDDLTVNLVSKIRFSTSSSMYIPLVLEQIGVLLRDNYCGEMEELERLWEMVEEGQNRAVDELVDMNFKRLREDRQVLFFDIALFIIPAGYSDLNDATPILSQMHGITSTSLRCEITVLKKHCALSVINNELRVHDIFTKYARSIPGNSARYVYRPSLHISCSQAAMEYGENRPRTSDPKKVHLRFLEARTICISTCDCDHDQEVRLHVEVGARAQALFVRNSCSYSNKCILGLSGNVLSLSCFRAENMQQVAVRSSGNDANLFNLVRLELRNDNITQHLQNRFSGQKRKRTGGSFFDFMSRQIQRSTESVRWLLKPSMFMSPYEQCFLQRASDLISAGRMRALRVLILHNFSGILRADMCPQLETLQVRSFLEEQIDVRIDKVPHLRRVIVSGHIYHPPFPSILSTTLGSRKARKLALNARDCPKLQEISVDGSFGQVTLVDGFLPSSLRRLALANDSCFGFRPSNLISSSAHQLTHLQSLDLSCMKVERLAFTRDGLGCLPSLEQLSLSYCTSLVHLSMDPGCLPNLHGLQMRDCYELQVFQGLEDIMLMAKFGFLRLLRLSHLQWQCDVTMRSSSSSCEVSSLQLGMIHVESCPRVRIDWNVLKTSKKLHYIDLHGSGVATIPQNKRQDMNNDDESKVSGRWMFSECQLTFLKYVWIRCPHDLQEIGGLQDLRSLEDLQLEDMPDLARVWGAWPASIRSIRFIDCPELIEVPPFEQAPDLSRLEFNRCVKLKAVEICFSEVQRFKTITFVECEIMEASPWEGQPIMMDKLRKRGEDYPLGETESFQLAVSGSKFASAAVLQGWLREAEMGSPLWEAAVEALMMWECAEKDTPGVLDDLRRYFSTLVENTTEEEDIEYLENYCIYDVFSGGF